MQRENLIIAVIVFLFIFGLGLALLVYANSHPLPVQEPSGYRVIIGR